MGPLALPKLYCLFITRVNWWNKRQYFSRWSPCFGFFVWPCYSRITHYPTLENPVLKVWKNQGQQRKLSNHWKSIKRCFWKEKKTGNDAKKAKKINKFLQKILHPTKSDLSFFKKKKVTQLSQSTIERSPLIQGLISSDLLNQINLLMYTSIFQTFLFDQMFKK